MDTVTQAALGATIGEAGFRGRLGGKAPVVGGLCGLLPDLDVLAALHDPWLRLVVHRGSSHSLLLLSVVAFGMAAAGWGWSRRRGSYWTWVHLCAWALLTHPLLDVTTTYGTQLLAPASRERFAIDAMSILDPVYSLPLFAACVLAWRQKVTERTSRRFAWAVLVLTTAYIGVGWVQSQRAVARATDQLQEAGFAPAEVRALPTLLNNQAFRVVGRNAEGDLRVGHLSMLAPERIDFLPLDRPDHPALAAVERAERGVLFEWFAMGMVHAEVREGGREVVLGDQRYGLITRPRATFFRARFRLDGAGRVVDAQRMGRATDADVGRELLALWDLLRGRRIRAHAGR